MFFLIVAGISYNLDTYPDAPCIDDLPALDEKWPHSRGNGLVKYSIHGAYGLQQLV